MWNIHRSLKYSKTCLKRPLLKIPKLAFTTNYFLMQVKSMYCRRLQWKHSAILASFIKLPFVIKIFVLSFLSDRFIQLYCTVIPLLPVTRQELTFSYYLHFSLYFIFMSLKPQSLWYADATQTPGLHNIMH